MRSQEQEQLPVVRERTPFSHCAEGIAQQMIRLFRGDTRQVMRQKDNGDYCVLRRGALTEEDIRDHLMGRISAAPYLLDQDCRCATFCFDIDIPKSDIPDLSSEIADKKEDEYLPVVGHIIDYLQDTYGLDSRNLIVEDTGGRGYHIWLFFEEPEPGKLVVALGEDVEAAMAIDCIELFPATASHGAKGFSKSVVRLPLGMHRKYPGAQSFLLDPGTLDAVPPQETAQLMADITFIPSEVLEQAQENARNRREEALQAAEDNAAELPAMPSPSTIAATGNMLSLCPALNRLVSKAKGEGHLLHHERFALASILIRCEDGEKQIHDIMSHCSDYERAETQKQIGSLRTCFPVSCRTLQSPRYLICDVWCCRLLLDAEQNTPPHPTPLWLCSKRKPRTEIDTDQNDPTIERVAAIDNLRRAWSQARAQAEQRDIFEDVIAYDAFEAHLEANLHVLQAELLSGRWKHEPFDCIRVPKEADAPDNARPLCWASPWDAVVALAVLNVIGPFIDSKLHPNALGNRLELGQRAEGQVFKDWRRLNRLRQLGREGFSEYGSDHQYVITDIKQFYECLRHDKLMAMLGEEVEDRKVRRIVAQFLEASWKTSDGAVQRSYAGGSSVGLPQGPALSAVLANLYVSGLDDMISGRCVEFVRYVDDLAILFGPEQDPAAEVDAVEDFLQEELDLRLNREKTEEPRPANETDPLTDHIGEARYAIVRSIRESEELSPAEIEEMRAALAATSGVTDLDLQRLTKYLGFYTAFSGGLDDSELQTSVLNLSVAVLEQERPRHGATCIAVEALVKAVVGGVRGASAELRRLMVERDDEYFAVVCFEAVRRHWGRVMEDGQEVPVSWEPLVELVADGIRSSSVVVSVAAMACLTRIGHALPGGNDPVWRRLMEDDSRLRTRAAVLLSRMGELGLSATGLEPQHGDDAQVFLIHAAEDLTDETVVSIGEALQKMTAPAHTIPALMMAGLRHADSRALQTCKSIEWLGDDGQLSQIAQYVASAFVQSIVSGQYADQSFAAVLQAASTADIQPLAKHLYVHGIYAGVAVEREEWHELVGWPEEDECGVIEAVDRLPEAPGVAERDLLVWSENGYWLHKGKDEDGESIFQETMAALQLESLAISAEELIEGLEMLHEADLLQMGVPMLNTSLETPYILTSSPAADLTELFEWRRHRDSISSTKIAGMMKDVGVLLELAQSALDRQGLSNALLPSPSLRTLVVEPERKISFRNVMAGFLRGRSYLDADGCLLELPEDAWEVYCLGLVFFELVTGTSISSINGWEGSRRIVESDAAKGRGALFRGIVGKATASQPESRYSTVGLMIKEIEVWGMIEESIEASDIGAPQAERLRCLSHVHLGANRSAHAVLSSGISLLEASLTIAGYAVTELRRQGQLEEEWIRPHLLEIEGDALCPPPHIASQQLDAAAQAIDAEWSQVTGAACIDMGTVTTHWLTVAAGALEVESFRRIVLAHVGHDWHGTVEEILIESGLINKAQCHVHMASQGRGALPIVSGGLQDVHQSLDRWVRADGSVAPSPSWPADLIGMAVLLAAVNDGIVISWDGGERPIGPHEERRDFEDAVAALLSVHQIELTGMSVAETDAALREAEAVISDSVKQLRRLGLAKREFGRLPKSAFETVYTEGMSKLDLGAVLERGTAATVSRSGLLPFPLPSEKHLTGCPVSVDLREITSADDEICTALSLPLYTHRTGDHVLPNPPKDKHWTYRPLSTLCKVLGSGQALWLLLPVGTFAIQYAARLAGWVDDYVLVRLLDEHMIEITGGLLVPYVVARMTKLLRQADSDSMSETSDLGQADQ